MMATMHRRTNSSTSTYLISAASSPVSGFLIYTDASLEEDSPDRPSIHSRTSSDRSNSSYISIDTTSDYQGVYTQSVPRRHPRKLGARSAVILRIVMFAVGTLALVYLLCDYIARSGTASTFLSNGVALDFARSVSGRKDDLSSSSSKRLVWHDFDRIKSSTNALSSGVVVPVKLRHLADFDAPDPYREVYLHSAYIDTRPLLISRPRKVDGTTTEPPQLAIIAQLGRGANQSQHVEQMLYDGFNPTRCYIVTKNKHGDRSETTSVRNTTVSVLADIHPDATELVNVMFHCSLVNDDGSWIDWENSEIFVTLSLNKLPPPSDAFLPVRALPRLDPLEHKTGFGSSAICLAPLIGDLYASSMADFISHYQALGFEHFYIFLLDPGTESINVLRQIAQRNDNVELIRWGMPATWKYSATHGHQRMINDYIVEPSAWNLPGIRNIDHTLEFALDGFGSGESRAWYFGQGAAYQDCAFRSMADGHRWMMPIDWDEYLFLKPAANKPWPPAPTSPRHTPLTEWMQSAQAQMNVRPRTVANLEEAKRAGLDVEALTKGLQPAAFEFVSTMGCLSCTPNSTDPPRDTPELRKLREQFPRLDLNEPGAGVPLTYFSPVRAEHWLKPGFYSKTISDPWAWWSIGIHEPALGYIDWAMTRTICSTTFGSMDRSSSQDAHCGSDLLQVFGYGTSLVVTPDLDVPALDYTSLSPMVVKSTAPVGSSPIDNEAHGRGGVLHFRKEEKLRERMTQFQHGAERYHWELFASPEGRRTITEERALPDWWWATFGVSIGGEPIVQDWSVLETMAPALLKMLTLKQKYGLRDWVGRESVQQQKPTYHHVLTHLRVRAISASRSILRKILLALAFGVSWYFLIRGFLYLNRSTSKKPIVNSSGPVLSESGASRDFMNIDVDSCSTHYYHYTTKVSPFLR